MQPDDHTLLGATPETAGLAKSLQEQDSHTSSTHSVALQSLSTGTLITLQTRNTCYQMRVVDGEKRRVVICGGKLFPERTEVEVVGAADDEQVRVGWMIEGLQLELSTLRGPVLTSMVQSFSVEEDPSALAPVSSLSHERPR